MIGENQVVGYHISILNKINMNFKRGQDPREKLKIGVENLNEVSYLFDLDGLAIYLDPTLNRDGICIDGLSATHCLISKSVYKKLDKTKLSRSIKNIRKRREARKKFIVEKWERMYLLPKCEKNKKINKH